MAKHSYVVSLLSAFMKKKLLCSYSNFNKEKYGREHKINRMSERNQQSEI